MASEYRRLLDIQPLSTVEAQDRDLVFDAGAFKQLNVQFMLLTNGNMSSGTNFLLTLQHAAVNEDGQLMDLKDDAGTVIQINLKSGTTAPSFQTCSSFLRYIRWNVTAEDTITVKSIASIDLVAKE